MQMDVTKLLTLAEAASQELGGLPLDKVLRSWAIHERNTATIRSDPQVRSEASLRIESLFRGDPNADIDLRDLQPFGLKNCQADRAWVRHQQKRLRDMRPADAKAG